MPCLNFIYSIVLCCLVLTVKMPCQVCSNGAAELSEQEQIRLKIEWDKLKILRALNLEAPPNFTEAETREFPRFPHFLTDPISQKASEEPSLEEIEDGGALKTVFVFGTLLDSEDSITPSCAASPKTFCLSFSLQADIAYSRVSGGLLWVKAAADREIRSMRIAEIKRGRHLDSEVTTAIVGRRNGSWVALNVSDFIGRWKTKSGKRPHYLRITCSECADSFTPTNYRKAFLELETQTRKSPNRNRRSDDEKDCRPDLFSSCCLKRLWVSFEELGEKFKFIVKPDGYWANYCTGNCRYGNTGVWGSVVVNSANSRKAKGEKIDERMIPCCAPRRMSALEIIWKSKADEFRKTLINDMTVHSCGCDR